MKSLNEIKNALATANKEVYTTRDVAKIGGVNYKYLLKYIAWYPQLRPESTSNRNLLWSKEDVIRFYEYKIAHHYSRRSTASSVSAPPAPITATPEVPSTEYVSPIDMLIQIDKTINEDPNVKAYYEMRNKFEQMNESALQKLFAPLLERFKFAYICKCIPEIQSQMLTCINKGKLRGMDKYKLDFNAFLKLVKFAHDNYVPLDAVDDQKNGIA